VSVKTGEGPVKAKGQISDDGNKMVIEAAEKIGVTHTRK
jgi:hypothetical protein